MKLSFYLRQLRTDNFCLMARLSDRSGSLYRTTGFLVKNKKDWDGNWLKGNSDANKLVTDWKANFDAYISSCAAKKITPEIAPAMLAVCGEKKLSSFTLLDAIDDYISFHQSVRKKRTLGRYTSLKNILIEYNDYRDKNPKLNLASLELENLSKFLLQDLTNYCVNDRSNQNSTIKRRLTYIKTILAFAKDRGMLSVSTINQRQPDLKTPDSNRFPLEENELAILKKYRTVSKDDQIKLDAFLFACETGLRYSDIVKISPVNIKSTGAGKVLDFHMTKGGTKMLIIPLSLFAQAIIGRYKVEYNEPFFGSLRASQNTNERLKKIFKLAGLDRICEVNELSGSESEITQAPLHSIAHFHMSRHTFGTLLIERGVPIVAVKEMMGHTKIETTMRYIRPNKKKSIDLVREALDSVEAKAV